MPGPKDSDRLERLERLHALRRDGALTDVEFEQEKRSLFQAGASRAEMEPAPVMNRWSRIRLWLLMLLILAAGLAALASFYLLPTEHPNQALGNGVTLRGALSVGASAATKGQAEGATAPEVKAAPAAEPAQAHYPRTQRYVPEAFWGGWDELISDGCRGREARFHFSNDTFMNFEVEYQVTSVRLYSPTEMDLRTTYYGENGSPERGEWMFKLTNGGRTLTGRRQGTSRFFRCPA